MAVNKAQVLPQGLTSHTLETELSSSNVQRKMTRERNKPQKKIPGFPETRDAPFPRTITRRTHQEL